MASTCFIQQNQQDPFVSENAWHRSFLILPKPYCPSKFSILVDIWFIQKTMLPQLCVVRKKFPCVVNKLWRDTV